MRTVAEGVIRQSEIAAAVDRVVDHLVILKLAVDIAVVRKTPRAWFWVIYPDGALFRASFDVLVCRFARLGAK